MSNERRYSEKEIAEIFHLASKEQESWRKNQSLSEGLSLSELQQIGEESGITPEFIAQAAAALENNTGFFESESLFGFPLAVSNKILLPRKLTEDEWERLVVDLRETYQKEGAITRDGSFLKWTDGDISVLAEPTGTGYQLRMTTAPQRKGATKFVLGLGVAVVLISLIFWVQVFFLGKVQWSTIAPGLFFLVIGMLPLFPLFFTPKWAERHRTKMEGIAKRLQERIGVSATSEVETELVEDESAVSEGSSVRLELDDRSSEDSGQSAASRSKLRS